MTIRNILFCLIFTFSGIVHSQTELPRSIINLGIGGGMNYGVFGMKSVIGYKNSGLLIGLGYVPGGKFGYEIGGQFGDKWIFVNAGYGIRGTIDVGENTMAVKSGSIIIGVMLDLGPKKRTFLELGIGHTFLTKEYEVLGVNLTEDSIIGIIGLGFRLGNLYVKL